MAKVWVTGCAGFLGSHLCDALLAAGHGVGGNDNLSQGELSNVPRGVDFYRFDCNDLDRLGPAMRTYTHLVHCAAAPYEGLSFFSPHHVTTNGVGASVGAFSAAIGAGVRRIVYCSSMARYGVGNPPFTEEQAARPCDPYGIGKVAGEAILRNLCDAHAVEYVIAVPSNIIGPRQRFDDPFRGVVSIFINLALQGRELIVFGEGGQQRMFSPYDCCVDALMKMIFEPGLSGEVINIGPSNSGATTVYALAQVVWLYCGHNEPPRIKFVPERVGDVKQAYCSVEKMENLFGIKDSMTMSECILAMIEDIRKRGPKPFNYDLPIEIRNHKTPAAWTERMF